MTASGLGLAAAAPLTAQVGTSATTAQAAALITISPTRVLDTRASSGGPIGVATAGPLGEGQTLSLVLTPPGPLPADATGAVLNVTLDGATVKTFVTVWPTGEARPLASTNNAEPGLITPNSGRQAGRGGSVSIFNANGSTNVVVDVVGYLVPMDKVVVTGAQVLVGAAAPARIPRQGRRHLLRQRRQGPSTDRRALVGVHPPTSTGAEGAVGPQRRDRPHRCAGSAGSPRHAGHARYAGHARCPGSSRCAGTPGTPGTAGAPGSSGCARPASTPGLRGVPGTPGRLASGRPARPGCARSDGLEHRHRVLCAHALGQRRPRRRRDRRQLPAGRSGHPLLEHRSDGPQHIQHLTCQHLRVTFQVPVSEAGQI